MSKPFRRAICWIRRDLRLHDHAALEAATREAEEVVVVFVFDTRILSALVDKGDRRVTFIHRSLQQIDTKLRERGSQLLVRIGDPVEEIPRLAQTLGAEAVYTGRDYEPYAAERDRSVSALLSNANIAFRALKDIVVFEGNEVLTLDGKPFRVYSPFARAWRKRLRPTEDLAELRPDMDAVAKNLEEFALPWEMSDIGFEPSELWLEPGETAGMERLDQFVPRMPAYGEVRDFPAQDGTSGLSVHLRFGTVSVRECVRKALELGGEGAEKWLSEVVWRDFYQSILFHYPEVVELPFQAQYGGLVYPGLDDHFEAWCSGQTGYPIVDAAMRCLKSTGWMHNRLRMVVASFLTKDLLVDYRKGEAHFARFLLDFDLASNNGGWQWAASTGSDPQPYFRIFNPTSQSEKFDPEARFIRTWVPELAELSDKAIHSPANASPMELAAAGVELGVTYPRPIVDHSVQREKAIALLASAKGR